MTAYPRDPVLPLTISLESSTPLYEQIEAQLRHLILRNVLAPGTSLPSVRALATSLGCSVITTRRAYQDLEQQGYVHTLQGRGTIVADVPAATRSQQRLAPVSLALAEAIRQAHATGLTPDELRAALETLLQEGDTP